MLQDIFMMVLEYVQKSCEIYSLNRSIECICDLVFMTSTDPRDIFKASETNNMSTVDRFLKHSRTNFTSLLEIASEKKYSNVLDHLIQCNEYTYEEIEQICFPMSMYDIPNLRILNILLKYHEFSEKFVWDFVHYSAGFIFEMCSHNFGNLLKRYLNDLDRNVQLYDSLHEPCIKGNIEIIKMILECPKIYMSEYKINCCIELAKVRRYYRIVDMLEEFPPERFKEINEEFQMGM
jgi:hypothetical protein